MNKKLSFEESSGFVKWWADKKYRVEFLVDGLANPQSLDESRGFKPVFSLKDSLRGALRHERTCYDVFYYNLTVKVIPNKKSIEG